MLGGIPKGDPRTTPARKKPVAVPRYGLLKVPVSRSFGKLMVDLTYRTEVVCKDGLRRDVEVGPLKPRQHSRGDGTLDVGDNARDDGEEE